MIEREAPKPLEYLGHAQDDASSINVPATISIACAGAAAVFAISACTGFVEYVAPAIAKNAGWINAALAIIAIIYGAVGALKAPRDSGWFNIALIGYATGLFVACLTPILFLL